jgi:hypothetical protein
MPTSERKGDADRRPSTPRLIITALIGSALEWYDFSLYGVTAALVFTAVLSDLLARRRFACRLRDLRCRLPV